MSLVQFPSPIGTQVVKGCHGAYMTCKAHNGRVVAEWLLDCCVHAEAGTVPINEVRRFGHWLKSEVQNNNRSWPSDSRLLPQRLAMKLA